MDIIFEPSVQHTGTTFLQVVIGHHRRHCILMQAGRRKQGHIGLICSDKEINLSADYALPKQVRKEFARLQTDTAETIGLIQSHFGEPHFGFLSHSCITMMINSFKTVVPLRDPLKVLMSCVIRYDSESKCELILNGFLFMAKLWKERRRSVFWFPIDLVDKLSPGGKISYLERMFRYLCLSPSYDYLNDVGNGWKKIGTWENYGETHPKIYDKAYCMKGHYLKYCYHKGYVDGIIRDMPKSYGCLKRNESELRPFLEEVGYENLIWWN